MSGQGLSQTNLNIYNADGTLISDRIVDADGKTLEITDMIDYRSDVVISPSRTFKHETNAGVWGIPLLNGQVDYCEITTLVPIERIFTGTVKFGFVSPDDIFAGAGVLNVTLFSDFAFTGVVIDSVTGAKFCRVNSEDAAGFAHGMQVTEDLITFNGNPINTTLKLQLGSTVLLPAFADDAAAAALPTGRMYQTDGTAASPLNVAGMLMVKQ